MSRRPGSLSREPDFLQLSEAETVSQFGSQVGRHEPRRTVPDAEVEARAQPAPVV